MSSPGLEPSPNSKASGDLTRRHSKTCAMNMKFIVEGCKDNVELQSMLLSAIREYEDDMNNAKASGESFTDAVRNTKAARNKEEQTGSSDDDEEEEVVPARPVPVSKEELLRRGLHMFGKVAQTIDHGLV